MAKRFSLLVFDRLQHERPHQIGVKPVALFTPPMFETWGRSGRFVNRFDLGYGPLKETKIGLAETPQRWFWQDWALSNDRESLNRLGGEPTWIQNAEYPNCPSCQMTIGFLFQLDSHLPTADGGEWLWGSGGIGYGFWCDSCKISGFLWQCT